MSSLVTVCVCLGVCVCVLFVKTITLAPFEIS